MEELLRRSTLYCDYNNNGGIEEEEKSMPEKGHVTVSDDGIEEDRTGHKLPQQLPSKFTANGS